jgi:hypothetical protein
MTRPVPQPDKAVAAAALLRPEDLDAARLGGLPVMRGGAWDNGGLPVPWNGG